MLLPHGYEGQGPDHSSARIERYLQLCAENNMTVARPSTPASYFHLLRRQAYARPRRPLIVFTPKAMLRLRGATSDIAEFTSGRFEPVIDDHRVADKAAVKRVVLVAGKVYYDLLAEIEKRELTDIALVRLEQYYPLPMGQLESVLETYPNAELVWAQEEPENMGAWPFICLELAKRLHNGRTITGVAPGIRITRHGVCEAQCAGAGRADGHGPDDLGAGRSSRVGAQASARLESTFSRRSAGAFSRQACCTFAVRVMPIRCSSLQSLQVARCSVTSRKSWSLSSR